MQACPICHSPINITDVQKQELLNRGIYVWTDDPLLTEEGLAGDQYKGLVFFNWRHIKEIQDARKQQEIDAQILNKTSFSEINAIVELKKVHINELRESTEKILSKLAESNPEISLSYYFNYDRDETYHGTWWYGQKINDKTDWTDVTLNLTGVRTSYTILSDIQEPLFLSDYATYASTYNINPNPDAVEHYYDYRGLWQDEGGITPDSEGHLPSSYKLVGHPNLVVNGINTANNTPIISSDLPPEVTSIRAIHIEELRHPIPVVIPVEEPPFHDLWMEPGFFQFNLRCLSSDKIRYRVYYDGFEEDAGGYITNTEVAKVESEWSYDENIAIYYVVPVEVGHTFLWINVGDQLITAPIIVTKGVTYEGDLTRVDVNEYVGSGEGCDGSSINVEVSLYNIKGSFDGVDFTLPLVKPSVYTTTVPEGILEVVSSYSSPEVSEALAINGYKIGGEMQFWTIHRNEIIYEDRNKDGVKEPITYAVIVDSGGSFKIGFSYDPTLV